MKIRELLKNGIEELNKYEIEDASLKTKILLEYELGVKNEYIAIHMEDEIEKQVIEKFKSNIQKLINGTPVQYITNLQEFYSLNFYVDGNVLIPQPDTEILVEEVINIARKMKKVPRILDICTGSGAIAISVSKNVEAEIVASDISENALKIAQKNAVNNQTKIKFFQSDMFENVSGKFDIIVSNPPYIATKNIDNLAIDVLHEPKLALDGGDDGLKFYRKISESALDYLKDDGFLVFEIGYDQANDVREILDKLKYKEIEVIKDYSNNDRVLIARKWVWGETV